jgi:hypothetical protein
MRRLLVVCLSAWLVLLYGCVGIPIDQSPTAYYKANADDPAALAKLTNYGQRKLVVGFYPGVKQHIYMPKDSFKGEAFAKATLFNVLFFIPSMVAILTEWMSDYENFQYYDHSGSLALFGYYKAYDPIVSDENMTVFESFFDEMSIRKLAGEDRLSIAQDIGDRTGLGTDRALVALYRFGL